MSILNNMIFQKDIINGYLLSKNELIEICDVVYDVEFKNEIEALIRLHKERVNEFLLKIEKKYISTVYKKISKTCIRYLNICLSNDGILSLIKYNFIKLLNNQWNTIK